MRCCVCGTEIAPGQPAIRHDPTGAIYCYPHEGLYLEHRLMEPSDYGRCACGFVYSAAHRVIDTCPQCGAALGSASGGRVVIQERPAVVPEAAAPPAEPSLPIASPPPEPDFLPPPPPGGPSETPGSSSKPGLRGRRGLVAALWAVAGILIVSGALLTLYERGGHHLPSLPQQPLQTYADPTSFHDDLTAAGIDCPGFGTVEGWTTVHPGAYGEKAWGNCQVDENTTISLRIYRSSADLTKGISLIQSGPVGKVAHLVAGDRWVVMVNESGTDYTEQILRITGGHEVTS